MKRQQTPEEVHEGLERRLGHPPREDIWQCLVVDRYVQEVLGGLLSLDGLVKRYRQLARIFARESRNTQRARSERVLPADRRLAALAEIWAAEAGRLPEVQAFRCEVLGGTCLAPEEVSAWVSRQVTQQGPPTVWVKVPLPEGACPEHPHDMRCLQGLVTLPEDSRTRWPVEWSLETLAYPSGERVSQVPVARGGTLWRLKELAAKITALFPLWNEPQVVVFVLTGAVPTLSRARASFEAATVGPPRITMDIDARMSPDEVADLYARARRDALQKRATPMTDKHLRLAVHLAQQLELSWSALMASWNKEYPMWSYSSTFSFARDAKAAWCRVTGRKWIPRPGGRKERERLPEGDAGSELMLQVPRIESNGSLESYRGSTGNLLGSEGQRADYR